MDRRKQTALDRFIKDECSRYDKHYQKCLFASKCRVFNGNRCGYFERNVLVVDPNYKFRQPGFDYTKLLGEYKQWTKTGRMGSIKTHYCECGAPIGYRQRLCNKCKAKKRKKSKHDYYHKFRRLKV